MASAHEVGVVCKMIEKAYGKGMDVDTVRLFVRCLADVPGEALIAGTVHLITTSKWQPKISELREAAFGLMMGAHEKPTAYEAWQEVNGNKMRPATATWSDPIIERAIDTLGGLKAYGASDTDDEMSWRARFVSSYEQLVQRGMDNAVMLPEVRCAAQQLQAGKVNQLLAEVANKRRIPEETG